MSGFVCFKSVPKPRYNSKKMFNGRLANQLFNKPLVH